MARQARAVAVGVPHHITQRGNRKLDVFFTKEDRARYLGWLVEYSERYGLDILAYCLMTNHIHIVGRPNNPTAMAKTFQLTHKRHSEAVNREQGWNGHLWQERYYSTTLDERHLSQAVLYVEQNPVRAKMVSQAHEYPWSSAACHCGLKEDIVLSGDPYWSGTLEDWPKLLGSTLDVESVDKLRACTNNGRPCGDGEFVESISKQLGRPLQQKPIGRPRLLKSK
jgi:putative transposase